MHKYKVGDIVEINGKKRIITSVNADSFVSTIYDPDIPVVTKKKESKEEAVKTTRKPAKKRG